MHKLRIAVREGERESLQTLQCVMEIKRKLETINCVTIREGEESQIIK